MATVLGAKRDGTAGADTSRGLVMTLLGEFVLPNGGVAWTQTLIEALALLGVRDKAARQAISRMHERGWLERTRVGRRTQWRLSESTRALLETGAERIYGFGRTGRAWDGSWLIVLASLPERDRSLRYRMAVGLSWSGFGSLGNGTWISPWADEESSAVQVLDGLGVDAASFVGTLGQLGKQSELVDQAWDLATLRGHYESFLADTAPLVENETSEGESSLTELALLVHRWRRFPFLDPGLPGDLLPADWPGQAAADRFTEARARLLEPATAQWLTWEENYSSPVQR
ncbi:MAG: PaaX family transcriptional regulator [Acidimicrobiales bacterium]